MDRMFILATCAGLALAFGVYKYKSSQRGANSSLAVSSAASSAMSSAASSAMSSAMDSSGASNSARSPTSRGSCRLEDLRLRLPVNGAAGKDWEIANYFDSQPAVSKVRDYMGNSGQDAVTYDGHAGIDFELPSFRPMDSGFPVLAAADGVVEGAFDQAPDRNRTCVKEEGNHVKLRHANGFATIYEHLRRDSIVVRVGDRVSAGMPLGLVGSSGCSSFPHLHLELVDCYGHSLDVMGERMFEAPPVYARSMPATVMETTLFQPAIHDMSNVMEPGTTDLNQITAGYEASIGVTVANMKAGDIIRIEFLSPNNSPAPFVFEQQLSNFHTRTHWWYNFQLDKPGRWLARISVNGRLQIDRPILATGHGASKGE